MSESREDWYIQRVTGGGEGVPLIVGYMGICAAQQGIRRLHISHNAPYLPQPPSSTQILHTLCFSFLLAITAVPREIENYAYAKFLEANKVHYGRCASCELRLFASLTLEHGLKITLYCWKKVISYFTLTLEQYRFPPPPPLSILTTGIGLLFLKLLHETGCKFFVWNIPVINISIPPPWR